MMRKEITELAETKERKAYLHDILVRDRRAKWNTRMRYLAMHLSWIVVLIAGALIPVVGTSDWANWVVPLGIVIVVFQGIDGIFHRTAAGGRAMDILRRGLEAEQRMLLVGAGPYAETADPYAVFVKRCERLVRANDAFMVDYFADIAVTKSEADPVEGESAPVDADGEEPPGT